MSTSEENPKLAKKLAKAAAKAAKKQARAEPPASVSAGRDVARDGLSPAERAAQAAEHQVGLHRWRVVVAAVGVIIALATLLVMLLR